MSLLPRSARLIAALGCLSLLAVACAGDRPTLEDPGASREVDAETPSPAEPVGDGSDGFTIRLAVGSDWSTDPADAGIGSVTDRVVAALLFEGLTRLDRSGAVVPGLAERWFVSDDRRQWTFVLPVGATDNHGLALTARDVKASLERIAARGAADQSVVQLMAISGWSEFVTGASGGAAGITAADERTVVIQLDKPFEPLAAVLAEPAFGITSVAVDGTVRTTGAYTLGEADELIAVDEAAGVSRIQLVTAEQSSGELLAQDLADWGVLEADDDGSAVPGAVLRQPVDLRTGLVIRLADIDERQALAAALNAAELALELDNATVAVASVPEARPESLPDALTVHLPDGPLAAISDELEAQLLAAGVDVSIVVLPATEFADAVASGEAIVFPMVMAGSGFGRSAGVAGSLPGGVDDVFGAADADRQALVTEILTAVDADDRAVLIEALDRALAAAYVWLPLGNAEVRVGISERMHALRILSDGTFDLSGFDVG